MSTPFSLGASSSEITQILKRHGLPSRALLTSSIIGTGRSPHHPRSEQARRRCHFTLPEDLPKAQSKWFDARLAERWPSNDSDGRIRIVGFAVEASQMFVPWLYQEAIPRSDEDCVAEHCSPASHLLQAWLIFNHLNMPAQQNMVMGQMCNLTAKRLDDDQLLDEEHVLLAKSSGKELPLRFARQVSSRSGRIGMISRAFPRVQLLCRKSGIVVMELVDDVEILCSQRTDVCGWDDSGSKVNLRGETKARSKRFPAVM